MVKHHTGRQYVRKHKKKPITPPTTDMGQTSQLPQAFNVWMAGSGGGHWTTIPVYGYM